MSDGGQHPLGQAAGKRVHEFVAGRLYARAQSRSSLSKNFSISTYAERRPRWPPQLTECITHTIGFSTATVAKRERFHAISIDAERMGRLSPPLWSQLFLPSEHSWLQRRPDPE